MIRPTGLVAWVERVTRALVHITTGHAMIHEGIAFSSIGILTVAGNKVGAITFKTPPEGYVHFQAAAIRSNVAVTASILEDYTKGVGDLESDLPAVNRNRNSTNEAAALLHGVADLNAVAGTGALTMATAPIGANLPAYKVGGDLSDTDEWPLKPDTTYIIAISNATAGAATIGYNVFWYEEDDA